MRTFLKLFPAACALLILATACTSPQKRAEENPEAFSRLSQDQQRMVLEGKIEEGMNEDAVYIALGRPSKKRDMRIEGETIVNWIYSRTITDEVPAYRDHYYRGSNGKIYRSSYYDPYYRSYVLDTFRVMFKQGKVVGWEELH